MDATPVISVVMSVHNHQAYVQEAVESVLAQTFRDWELILINNGSTDQSPRIIDELARRDQRIRPLHQANLGLAAARNCGLELARAPWIAYLDSDDVWFPHALTTYAAHIEQHPDAQFVFGHAHRLRGTSVIELVGAHQDRPTGTRELFLRMYLTPLTVCHRRTLWEHAGRFDRRLTWCDDYDLFLRMSLSCVFEPVRQALGLRRRHASNLSKPSGPSQQLEAEVLRRFAEGPGRETLDGRTVAHRLGQVYGRAARHYLRERRHPEALAMSQEAMRWAPCWRYRMMQRMCAWFAPQSVDQRIDQSAGD